MCERKPSQAFFQDGALAETGRMLVYGAGVLTEVVCTGPVTAATTPLLTLQDGQQGPVLFSLSASGLHTFTGMNLEYQNGLWLVNVPGAGPLFGKYTIGAYIQDDSPDPMAEQLALIRRAVLEGNAKLAALVDGLLHGNPKVA